jgi:hypothetical protein
MTQVCVRICNVVYLFNSGNNVAECPGMFMNGPLFVVFIMSYV